MKKIIGVVFLWLVFSFQTQADFEEHEPLPPVPESISQSDAVDIAKQYIIQGEKLVDSFDNSLSDFKIAIDGLNKMNTDCSNFAKSKLKILEHMKQKTICNPDNYTNLKNRYKAIAERLDKMKPLLEEVKKNIPSLIQAIGQMGGYSTEVKTLKKVEQSTEDLGQQWKDLEKKGSQQPLD